MTPTGRFRGLFFYGILFFFALFKTTSSSNYVEYKSPLKSLETLRQSLPSGWQVERVVEPVFGGEILIVQAGTEFTEKIFLVHGMGKNGFKDWLKVIPHLAERYHVIALDLPGFGYSAVPLGKYSPKNYSRVLSWVLDRYSGGSAVVLAHSLGGAAALRLADQHPGQVKKLILVDAAGILHRIPFLTFLTSKQTVAKNQPKPVTTSEKIHSSSSIRDVALSWMFNAPFAIDMLRKNDELWGMALPEGNVNAALALVDEDLSDVIHTLSVPTQIIWGSADRSAPLRTGQMLARRLPKAELHILEGVGHFPMGAATEAFLTVLDQALLADPAAPPSSNQGAAKIELKDLICDKEKSKVYSGHFREVRIDDSSDMRLQDLFAQRLVIRKSKVEMLNVTVQSEDVALDVTDSILEVTASEFSGKVALRCDDSHLDFAGVLLKARGDAIQASRSTYLIGSISAIQSPGFTGYWHGKINDQVKRLP